MVVSLHKKKTCQVMRRKELFYYVTRGSNVTRDVYWCVTVDYRQIANDNIANQIHGFTIDYGKFILISVINKQIMYWSQHLFHLNKSLNLTETVKVFSFTPHILKGWFCCELIKKSMNCSNINITLETF